jgi:DNA polymerase-3 subunit delta
MTFDQIIEDLRQKIYRPFYLLFGEEPYFIDVITDHIQDNVLTDLEKEFNLSLVYGRETDMGYVVDLAKRYPMMANYHVVIVREGQDMERVTDKLEQLQAYLEHIVPTTILVFCYKYKKIDKRTSLARMAEKSGVLFESKRLYDSELPVWITTQVARRGYAIEPDAARLLSEYLGSDLGKIINELDKLRINLPAGGRITLEAIERNIGISKDYNVFELQKALGRKDVFSANRIIGHFAANPKENHPIMVTAVLFSFFSKLLIFHQLDRTRPRNELAAKLSVNPFFIRDYEDAARNYSSRQVVRVIGLLREYDLRAKGVGNVSDDEGEILKEMVFRILH